MSTEPLAVTVQAHVLTKVTTCLPSEPPSQPTQPSHLEKLNLADPQFLVSRPVDIILGADAYGQVIKPNIIRNMSSPLIAQLSIFDEQECEDHFKTTHSRDSAGRYIVRLPLKIHPRALGNSYQTAHSCLQRTLRRFSKDAQYNQLYTKFMLEYEQLGHMLGSTTTALRVVFNGSSPTSSGYSLNDLLHTGPNLMLNIADLLIWIRRYKHLFATDVTKMYRQIKVHPDDWSLQQILWLDDTQKETQYQLTTVTYGTKAAPYLAVRTLLQLADDEGSKYPLAVEPIKNGRYVDDIFGGADTAEHLQDVANQLTQLCQAGGFPLAKWHSTSKSLLEDLAPEQTNAAISFDDCATKILGIKWIPHQDTLNFSTISATQRTQFTKRLILSEVAQLFDPLGFVAPVIIRAKILIQELWLQELSWDDILPLHITQRWLCIREDLTSLAKLSIPRWFNTTTTSTVELHGFADASVLAMAAVVYLVVHAPSTGTQASLVCSKTRVTPLKRLTIPRLLRITALCLKFVDKLFKRKDALPTHSISAADMERARIYWIQATQSAFFKDELAAFAKGTTLPTTHPFTRLTAYLDHQGIARLFIWKLSPITQPTRSSQYIADSQQEEELQPLSTQIAVPTSKEQTHN
ncbi:uncharacterized protein LOC123989001 [Osmia bicornis bicornis]|uniref:uncharacterized protein LOC123989001 n=1 Tax=Osmia bicornis bicornis TaxID=1437191 RepID=UPI001EAF39A1|nr:uncharacterized protein LOC123989001 [Osmia bicornis bicornis]